MTDGNACLFHFFERFLIDNQFNSGIEEATNVNEQV